MAIKTLADIDSPQILGNKTLQRVPGTVELLAAIASSVQLIDGNNQTFVCNAPITGFISGQVLQNMTLDFSTMPAQAGQDICLLISGTKGTPVALTANTLKDGVIVQVGTTATFTVGQWVWLESTAIWSSEDNTPYGQLARIKTINSGTQLTLYSGVVVPFNTAASATIAPLTMVERPRFKNVKIIGASGTDQVGIWYNYCLDGSDEDVVITGVENAGIVWYRCANMKGTATVRNAQGTNAYGYGIYGGCYGCRVTGHGDDLRHFVSIGDNDGINIDNIVSSSTMTNMRSAGLDSHPASIGTIFANNNIGLAGTDTAEGITMQGLDMVCENNNVRGVGNAGWGIMFQPMVDGFEARASINRNHIYFNDTSTGTTVGIQAQTQASFGSNINGLSITDNKFYGGANATTTYHVYIQANRNPSFIKRVNVTGNTSVDASKTFGAYIRANAANSAIYTIALHANHFKASSTYALLLQTDGASAVLETAIITGNTLDGGSTANLGLLASGGSSSITTIVEDNNTFVNGGLIYSLSGVTTGLKLKSAKREAIVTNTSASYTLVPTSDTFIMNLGSTITLTLPTAVTFPGRELFIKNIQANAVNSASSNIQPIDSATLGTAILPNTDGAWALIKSNGTDWVVMQRGT